MSNFSRFNELWNMGKIEKPMVLLIGGYIGTGKSTFAKYVSENINNTTVLPTGIIRAIYQTIVLEDKYPEVFSHTYDYVDKKEALANFVKQVSIIQNGIEKIVSFAFSEGQHFIIEGNHITPDFCLELAKKYPVISIFFKVSDKQRYRQTITGSTHFRKFNQTQLDIIYFLHDYFVSETKKHKLSLFNLDETKEAIKYIKEQLNV
jgi:2-phosphoglycerate kinase